MIPAKPGTKLTTRELEVLQDLWDGQQNKQIAFHLGLSIKTIEYHRANINRRLEVVGIPALFRKALGLGLIKL